MSRDLLQPECSQEAMACFSKPVLQARWEQSNLQGLHRCGLGVI